MDPDTPMAIVAAAAPNGRRSSLAQPHAGQCRQQEDRDG
jgi:hypothetical protein